MSNLPDNVTEAMIDRLYAGPSEAEEAYELASCLVNAAITQAWEKYPNTTEVDAADRWIMIASALKRAEDKLSGFVYLGPVTVKQMRADHAEAYAANLEHDQAGVAECVAEVLWQYGKAIAAARENPEGL